MLYLPIGVAGQLKEGDVSSGALVTQPILKISRSIASSSPVALCVMDEPAELKLDYGYLGPMLCCCKTEDFTDF
ncbi:hypothetical protein TNCV_2128231 [Trichonephila clavipes]|nr:hypothetical protein TNCV_2128231 [Trichonephila clavipes]